MKCFPAHNGNMTCSWNGCHFFGPLGYVFHRWCVEFSCRFRPVNVSCDVSLKSL